MFAELPKRDSGSDHVGVMIKMAFGTACVVTAVSLFTGCKPLNGVDPLESGEHSTEVLRVVPSSSDRRDYRDFQEERVRRLEGDNATQPPIVKPSAGVDVSSEF